MASPTAAPGGGAPQPIAPPLSPALTVAAVARGLGVAPATLRTWDRRYGLGPTSHAAGSHRRYTPADVARLSSMRRLTLQGVSPAEAARVALATGADDSVSPDVMRERLSGAGGGRVIPMPEGSPQARGLARAAMGLDSAACTEIVRGAIRSDGVVQTWEGLLVPVLIGIGERWSATGRGIEVEHLLSECIMGALRAEVRQLHVRGSTGNRRPVLLACSEDDQHSLPLHALAAALAEQRIGSKVLGPRVPRTALAEAVRRSGPAAVFIWSQLVSTGDPRQLATLPALRPPVLIVVGGPGWQLDSLPPEIVPAVSLGGAVERLAAATGVATGG